MKPSFFARHSLVVLVVVAFLMPFMLMGTRRSLLSNKNDIKSWLPAQYEETATFRWYRERFESDMFVLASWEGCTLDSPELELMARKLLPPDDNPHSRVPPLRFFKSARTGTQLVNDLVNEQRLTREQAIRRLQGFVVGPDGKQTCLVLTLNPAAETLWEAQQAEGLHPRRQKFLHAVVDNIYSVAEKDCAIPPERLHLGGPPIDNVAIDREGEKSLMRLAGVSAVVGLFMSWWCLRSWGLTAMVFTTAIFSAGLALGAVYFTGSSMNAILLTMPSLVYVAATSGAIHLANYYRDTVKHQGFEGAADRAVRSAWVPLFLATGTTAVGLVSLGVSELVPIKMFGVYSAIGVVISFVVLCTYMPAALEFWPIRSIARPSGGGIYDPGLSPKWRHVGEFIIRRSNWVLAACFAMLAVGIYGVTRVETSVKLMRLFSPEASIIQDYAWLEKNLGPLVPMEVVVRIDAEKSSLDLLDQMRLVSQVQQAVDQLPEVGSTLAAPTFARTLPRRPSLIERRTWITLLDRHRDDLREYLHTEGNEELWRVSARVGALTDVDYGLFVDDIKRRVEPVLDQYRAQGIEGLSAVYTGLVPLIYKAQHSMLDGLILGFVGDLVLVGLAIIFLMRDWSAGGLLAIPCIFPLAITFGVMGLLGIVVDTGTVMTPAVALGVTVDDAIHFMIWCRHGQEKGMDRRRAIMFAYEDCARAVYQSWGVIGLGLSAFALSAFTPTQRFGYLMISLLTVSSFANLVLLPALLASPMGHFFWKYGARRAAKKQAAIAEPAAPQENTSRDPQERGKRSVHGAHPIRESIIN